MLLSNFTDAACMFMCLVLYGSAIAGSILRVDVHRFTGMYIINHNMLLIVIYAIGDFFFS